MAPLEGGVVNNNNTTKEVDAGKLETQLGALKAGAQFVC